MEWSTWWPRPLPGGAPDAAGGAPGAAPGRPCTEAAARAGKRRRGTTTRAVRTQAARPGSDARSPCRALAPCVDGGSRTIAAPHPLAKLS